MSTSYDLVFQKFMHEIRDFDLTSMTQDEMEIENKLTLSKAISLFTNCKVNLSRNDETNVFINDLSEELQWIIADYMRRVWFDEKLNDGSLLKLNLTDRDFKMFSPANHLDILSKLKKQFDKELKLRVNTYLYHNYDYSQLSK